MKVPTLYTVGEFDEANPVIVRRFAAMTPGARVVVIPGSAHLSEWDAPEAMNKAIRDFLSKADSTETRK